MKTNSQQEKKIEHFFSLVNILGSVNYNLLIKIFEEFGISFTQFTSQKSLKLKIALYSGHYHECMYFCTNYLDLINYVIKIN